MSWEQIYLKFATHLPWCPLRLNDSVPATRAATQTWRTSCGSAVEGSPSTRFSSLLANTIPFASLAIHVGSSEGRTRTTGPAMSPTASAETQLWSSGLSSSSDGFAVSVSVFRVLEDPSLSALRTLRFLGLSPLNVRGFTILVRVVKLWGSDWRRK